MDEKKLSGAIKIYILCIVMTVIAALIFVSFLITKIYSIYDIDPMYTILSLISLIPLLILCFVARKNTSFVKSFLILLFSFLMLALFMRSSILYTLSTNNMYTTDISKYQTALSRYGYPENPEVSFFPAEISGDMQNPIFYQWESIDKKKQLFLYYQTSPENLSQIVENVSSLAAQSNNSEILDGRSLDVPHFNNNILQFDYDYLYDFDCIIISQSSVTNGDSISKTSYGIMYSEQTSEIIYFTDMTTTRTS